MLTRRTATVTMSAPEAACACAITACEVYLPVPTIRRDANVRPAMTNGVSFNSQLPTPQTRSAAADKVHDFDPVAVADDHLWKAVALDDGEVVFHGDAP